LFDAFLFMTTEEKIKSLVSLGEKQSYLTYEKINETFPNSGPDELEKIYVELLLAGVQIIEQGSGKDSDS
jgi:hypothetical protein